MVRKTSVRIGLVAGLAFLAGLAEAASAVYPQASYAGARVVRSGGVIFVKDARDKTLWTILPEPRGDYLKDVTVTTTVDRLVIHASPAFKAGVVKIVMDSADILEPRLKGTDIALRTTWIGDRATGANLYFEGHTVTGKHYYRMRVADMKGHPKTYAFSAESPADLKSLHLRYDIVRSGPGPVSVLASSYGLETDFPRVEPERFVKPELLFHAPFDGTARAVIAKGGAEPLVAKGLGFASGKIGGAVRFTAKARSELAYPQAGNVVPERGTVAVWCRREWAKGARSWRSVFAFPQDRHHTGWNRAGSGALWFWWLGDVLRADQSDDDDSYVTQGGIPADDAWVHIAFTWNGSSTHLYVNGKSRRAISDGHSAMAAALKTVDPYTFARLPVDRFYVGNREGHEQLDGLLDDLRIYSAPLSADEIRALWKKDAGAQESQGPDYSDFAKGANPWSKPSGELDLEPVETVTFDAAAVVRLEKAERFRAVGDKAVKALGGTAYLEAGEKAGSRFAVRFTLATNTPLWCFEFDYPDDAKRTADLIVQTCRPIGGDYTMQVGYATGAEYPNTGRVLTHRCLYWASAPEVAVVAMTARDKAPAALAAIRLYRVRDGKLPVARIDPPPAVGGWRRSFVAYNEDCAIGYDFGTPRTVGFERDELRTMINRAAAYMKYVGEDTLAYPGCWYQGLIGERYNPRHHAPDFLSAWYTAFDREGLHLMPTLNWHNIDVPDGLVTRESMKSGALHATGVNILSNGLVNTEWHGSPPNFNIASPNVQAAILKEIDTLIAQGGDHPSFRGLCFHLTRHCILWWGAIDGGYNDYAVDAFARAKGLAIPVNRNDPLRGKAYAAWILANARNEWIQWRCDVVTAFYAQVAARLRARRPDLKLWLNSFATSILTHPRVLEADFVSTVNRESGLDIFALEKAIPNLIVCQSVNPADYRWRGEWLETPALQARQLELPTAESTFSLLDGASFPWAGQHDRYWESAIGRGGLSGGKNTLTCPWMQECAWRVTTINPSGRYALKHFAEPLRYHDLLGFSKGGFLIGTYGMEEVLTPFMQAFRSLPAVVFSDEASPDTLVKIRSREFAGRMWLYIVNTSDRTKTVTWKFPRGMVDLVSGAHMGGRFFAAEQTLELAPYELRAFATGVR